MSRRRDDDGGLVYSSEHGRMCPGCGQPADRCDCQAEATPPSSAGPVRVGRETKGRKGKGVTVVSGVPLAAPELAKLAKELKRCCGSGGTVKDGVIEIQGDHRDLMVLELRKRGWTVKRSGG